MTRVISGEKITVIERNGDRECEMCGEVSELRPYGPNNEWICFDCGMKDEKMSTNKFLEILNRAETTVIK